MQHRCQGAGWKGIPFSCNIALITILVIIVFFSMACNYLFTEADAEEIIPVVLLKLPRSGSTWFTETLNSGNRVYISKELIQRSDREIFSPEDMEDHIIKALSKPTGKLAASGRWLPDSRFVRDFLLHKSLKALRGVTVLGFSVNLEHCKGVNWQRVFSAVPNLRIVQLVRTNVIKTAVSGYRGQLMHALCGSSNLPSSDTDIASSKRCKMIPDRVPWNFTDFRSQVSSWQRRFDAFDDAVKTIKCIDSSKVGRNSSSDVRSNAISRNMKKVITVSYEELQLDEEGTIKRLFAELLTPAVSRSRQQQLKNSFRSSKEVTTTSPKTSQAVAGTMVQNLKIGGTSKASSSSNWMKRTKEDLREVLLNFDEIESHLLAAGPRCACLLQQLRDNIPRVSRRCASSSSSSSDNRSTSSIVDNSTVHRDADLTATTYCL